MYVICLNILFHIALQPIVFSLTATLTKLRSYLTILKVYDDKKYLCTQFRYYLENIKFKFVRNNNFVKVSGYYLIINFIIIIDNYNLYFKGIERKSLYFFTNILNNKQINSKKLFYYIMVLQKYTYFSETIIVVIIKCIFCMYVWKS